MKAVIADKEASITPNDPGVGVSESLIHNTVKVALVYSEEPMSGD
jgi:hypothetical protein